MAIEILTVDREFCPVDLLLFRRMRREVPGLVEATLELNPGLSDLGEFLPIGTKVKVNIPEPKRRAEPRRIIRLTD